MARAEQQISPAGTVHVKKLYDGTELLATEPLERFLAQALGHQDHLAQDRQRLAVALAALSGDPAAGDDAAADCRP